MGRTFKERSVKG